MSTARKPFSLVYDLETTRPGEQVHAEPEDAHEVYRAFLGHEVFALRLRDVERAGKLRLRLVAVEAAEFEAARMCRYDLHDEGRAAAHGRTARFCDVLYHKVVRLQARARGEVHDGA